MSESIFPLCQKCKKAVLLPLSDFFANAGVGVALIFKSWACSDPKCGFQVRVDKGEVSFDSVHERKNH